MSVDTLKPARRELRPTHALAEYWQRQAMKAREELRSAYS